MKNNSKRTISSTSYLDATGSIRFGMTNDYMFRAVLQEHNHVLKGLICSVLHLKPEEVKSVVITNPIKLGEAIDEKEFILDINVKLNNSAIINLDIDNKSLLSTRKLDTPLSSYAPENDITQDFSPMHRRCIYNGLKSLLERGTSEQQMENQYN